MAMAGAVVMLKDIAISFTYDMLKLDPYHVLAELTGAMLLAVRDQAEHLIAEGHVDQEGLKLVITKGRLTNGI
jgi:hypothetical protein